jgi:hypothetical protein
MKQYILFIGGTGARCAESFLYMSAAGLVGDDPVEMLLLDADNSNGDFTTACVLREQYQTLHNELHDAGDPKRGGNVSFRKDVQGNKCVIGSSGMIEKSSLHLQDLNSSTYGSAKTRFTESERLMQILYTRGEMENEITSVGYFGHPNVGAAAIRATIIKDEDFEGEKQRQSEYGRFCRDIIETVDKNEDARVLIVGSLFGGSGASALPALAEDIRNKVNDLSMKKSEESLRIGAVMMLPYFSIRRAIGANAQANASEFALATKDALWYYSDSKVNPFNRCYLLGSKILESYDNKGSGGPNQQNPHHIVEWEAALAAADFFGAVTISSDRPEHLLKRIHYWQTNAEHAMYIKDWGDFSADVRQRLISFTLTSMIMTRHFLPEMKTMSNRRTKIGWYLNYVGADGWYDSHDGQETVRNLEAFLKGYLTWFTQSLSHRSLKIDLVDSVLFNYLAAGDEKEIRRMMKKPGELFLGIQARSLRRILVDINKGLGAPYKFKTLFHGVYTYSNTMLQRSSAASYPSVSAAV